MTPKLNRTESLFGKLQRLPKRLAAHAKAEAVHELRTTIRRIETLLSARGNSDRKERRLRKQLNRLRRNAGKVRDIDVQIAALKTLKLDSAARDKTRVLRFLEKARAKRAIKMTRTLEAELASGLKKRLKRTASRLNDRGNQPASSQKNADAEKIVATALDQFAGLVESSKALTEQNLHDFRMGCKRVRYFAEMAGEIPQVRPITTQLKRVQDSIGTWHDWVELTSTADHELTDESPLIAALRANTRSRFLEALRITNDAKRRLLELREGAAQHKSPQPAEPPKAAISQAATA